MMTADLDAATKTLRPASPTASNASASRSVATTDDVFNVFEARRARSYAVGMVALSLFALSVMLWLGGDRLGQLIHGTALVITASIGGFYLFATRDVSRFKVWHVQALACVGVFVNATGFVYWGPLSAYLAVGSASAYAFASGTGPRAMIWPCTISLVANIGVSVVQLEGLIPIKTWVLPAPTLDLSGQIILVVAMQIVFAAASVGGMEAYRIMREVIEEHRAALRALAQRDAQLAEAHEAVRQARGPSEGRYTGEQLGRFQLGHVLGRGAMGEIYAGVDERGQTCAVKVLAQHLLGNDDALRRFQREAQVISGLDVENIVRVLDVAPPTAAVPYIAMERLEGKDLSALIKDKPVRDLSEVVTIMQGLAAGLDVAHQHGVVHRDLKPSNVYAASVAGRVVWKLLDFGVSKLHGSEATLTAAHVVGTPGYMAPEQAAGGDIDLRADVYALGVLAYRLLTGRPAVVPGNPQAMFNEVMNRMPPRPSGIVAMSAEVEAVLAIALAKSRADRFASAGELASALAGAAAGKLSAAYVERSTSLLRATPWSGWVRVTRGRATTPVTR